MRLAVAGWTKAPKICSSRLSASRGCRATELPPVLQLQRWISGRKGRARFNGALCSPRTKPSFPCSRWPCLHGIDGFVRNSSLFANGASAALLSDAVRKALNWGNARRTNAVFARGRPACRRGPQIAYKTVNSVHARHAFARNQRFCTQVRGRSLWLLRRVVPPSRGRGRNKGRYAQGVAPRHRSAARGIRRDGVA